MNVINFDYEGNEIPFRVDENGQVFMNGTKMAEPFPDKKVHYFLRNKNTIDLINTIHEEKDELRIINPNESFMVEVVLGKGKPQGTWLHEDLVLEFARWLDPKFNRWCNQRIKEILNQGFSALTLEAREYIEDEIGEEVRLMNAVVEAVQSGANAYKS